MINVNFEDIKKHPVICGCIVIMLIMVFPFCQSYFSNIGKQLVNPKTDSEECSGKQSIAGNNNNSINGSSNSIQWTNNYYSSNKKDSDLISYTESGKNAVEIFNEVTLVVKELKKYVNEIAAGGVIDFSNIKFDCPVLSNVNKRSTLEKDMELYTQMSNLSQNISLIKSKQDLPVCIEQGEDILSRIKVNYDVKDYLSENKIVSNCVSADASVVAGNKSNN